ncbi:alpha/beta fold hydrolase [soil metagenome]
MLRALIPALSALAFATVGHAQAPTSSPALQPTAPAASKWPVQEHDLIVRDFKFRSGETLPELRLHYLTLGTPRRDAQGHVTNAVMGLHGTGGLGRSLINPVFADVLFKPGGRLDIQKWFVILPDGIGHGGSSKPSDGLRMRFPHYDYADMVEAQHRILVDGLKVDRLRLIIGTSMGCMHAFVWGEAYPGFAQALMPLACQSVELAGRNRMWRQGIIDIIEADPDWKGGDYTTPPVHALRAAAIIQSIAGSAPLPQQIAMPTREKAEANLRQVEKRGEAVDADDLIYALNASRTYDPSRDLEKITVPVTWINSGDDFINPPELGLAEPASHRMPKARFVLIPASKDTHGHGTHTWASLWEGELGKLIARSGGEP